MVSDARKRFSAVRQAFNRLFPDAKGNKARHLNVLAAMVSGIVGAGCAQLPKIAGQFPSGAKRESRIKRFHRWLRNERIQGEIYFLPFAEYLIASLAHLPVVLVIDGSTTGRGCMTLMIGLVYHKRALPLSWLTVEGKKGHLAEQLHLELLQQIA
jgi:hypothetical protein